MAQQNQSMPMDNVKANMMKKMPKVIKKVQKKKKGNPSFGKVANSVKKTMGY